MNDGDIAQMRDYIEVTHQTLPTEPGERPACVGRGGKSFGKVRG